MRTVLALCLLVQVLSVPIPHHPEQHLEPDPVKCDEDGVQQASQVVFKHITTHHHHGYKYKLNKMTSSKLQKKDDTNCEFHLELELEETTCHVVNPKPLEECKVREMEETKVESSCNVTLTVAQGNATAIKYICKCEPASAEEIVKVCPDCPVLLPLTDPKGLESIREALKKFHDETNETNHFKLLEVGRISTQYMFTGQSYFAEFAVVETHCSRQENPKEPHKCKMLGKREARFGFCKSTLLGNGEISVDCDIYEAQNKTSHHHHHFHHEGRGERLHGPHSHDGPPSHPDHPPKPPGGPGHRGGPPAHPDGLPRPPHVKHGHHDGPPAHPDGLPRPPHGLPEHHGHPHKFPESSEDHHQHFCSMPDTACEKVHPIHSYPPRFKRLGILPGGIGCHHRILSVAGPHPRPKQP